MPPSAYFYYTHPRAGVLKIGGKQAIFSLSRYLGFVPGGRGELEHPT
jgi:hypothetical protein